MNNESKNSGIIEIGSVVDVPWVTDEIVDLVSLPLENWDEIPPSNRGEFPCRVLYAAVTPEDYEILVLTSSQLSQTLREIPWEIRETRCPFL